MDDGRGFQTRAGRVPTSIVVQGVDEDAAATAPEARHLKGGRSRVLRGLLIAALVPVTFLVVVTIAWAVDTSVKGGKVVRNVTIAGDPVGGLAEEDVPEVVARVAKEMRNRPVHVVTPTARYETTADAIGLALDEKATAEAVVDVGRSESFPLRPVRWLQSFLSPRDAPLEFMASPTTVREHVIKLEKAMRKAPVEPSITYDGKSFATIPGKPGHGIDTDAVAARLPTAATATDEEPIVVTVRPGTIAPRFDDTDAEALAAEAGELADKKLRVEAGGKSGEISIEVLSRWMRAVPRDDALTLELDSASVLNDLRTIVTGFGDGPKDAHFTIQGGKPVLIAGEAGTVCCGDASPTLIMAALQHGDESVTLDITKREPAFTTAQAKALGIKEEIGQPSEFGPTTHHKCCAPRVTNIHLIADAMRGAIIMPGQTFSVNAYVGQRTREKGYVVAGAIVDGVEGEQVGGGVSQFATTFFNASLFAGMEFGEYQSHSIWFDRYPKGHEATISWQHPDLQIKNPTPYAVLVWPTYDETTLTVHLYSTTYFSSVTVGQPSSSPSGRCTRWTTPRTRTAPDGTVLRDSVHARYRPGEGVSC
jgi:vancomycin resistance protein YoaR